LAWHRCFARGGFEAPLLAAILVATVTAETGCEGRQPLAGASTSIGQPEPEGERPGLAESLVVPPSLPDLIGTRPRTCPGRVLGGKYGQLGGQGGTCGRTPAVSYRRPRASDPPGDPMPPYLYNYGTVMVETPEPCPPRGRWIGETIFGRCAKGKRQPCQPVVFDCRYRWTDPTSGPKYAELGGQDNLERPFKLACDQPLVALQAEGVSYPALPTAAFNALRNNYRSAVEWVPDDQIAALQRRQSPVDIAVVDSAIFAYDDDVNRDFYGHGRAVGRVIADLACPGGNKQACRVDNHLALDRQALGALPDREHGGVYGDLSTLALTIHAALDGWVARAETSKTRPPLVINLSLGWDPRHAGKLKAFNIERRAELGGDGGDGRDGDACPVTSTAGDGAKPDPQYQLLEDGVRRAIERASCLGALVVAAAGNGDVPKVANVSDPDSGAMLPAAWEALPAPTDQACEDRGLLRTGWSRPRGLGPGSYHPLVYAATGVEYAHRFILSNTRSNGISRLGGPGLVVVSGETRPPGPGVGAAQHTLPLSGSSMGAAAVSGVAAAAWSLRPDASPHEIMAILFRTGIRAFQYSGLSGMNDIGQEATPTLELGDFCRLNTQDCYCQTGVASCRWTRSVSHCRALTVAAALPRGQSFCPCQTQTLSSGEVRTTCPGASSYRFQDVPGLATDAPPAESMPVADANPSGRLQDDARAALGDSYAPWSGPQPPPSSCPACGTDVGGGGSFHGSYGSGGFYYRRIVAAEAAPGPGADIARSYLTMFGRNANDSRTLLLFDRDRCAATGAGCDQLAGAPFVVKLAPADATYLDLADVVLLSTVLDLGDGIVKVHSQPLPIARPSR
jgi:hypothetical protein